jgi:hypothetical protein
MICNPNVSVLVAAEDVINGDRANEEGVLNVGPVVVSGSSARLGDVWTVSERSSQGETTMRMCCFSIMAPWGGFWSVLVAG